MITNSPPLRLPNYRSDIVPVLIGTGPDNLKKRVNIELSARMIQIGARATTTLNTIYQK